MRKQCYTITVAILMTFSLLIGCAQKNNGDELKDELLAAIAKQAELTSYRFSGSSVLNLDWAAFAGVVQEPLTASLTSMITKGTIEWQGVLDASEARLEADLVIKPQQMTSAFNIPLLVNNNKLYFQIPLLVTSEDEYLTADLNGQPTELPFSRMLGLFIDGLDGKYFSVGSDNEQTKTIEIAITKDNFTHIIEVLSEKLPLMIPELQTSNLLNSQSTEKWLAWVNDEFAQKFTVDELDQPGLLSFTINDAGFIVGQHITLYYANQSLQMNQTMDQINEQVQFNKQIPEETRPFTGQNQ